MRTVLLVSLLILSICVVSGCSTSNPQTAAATTVGASSTSGAIVTTPPSDPHWSGATWVPFAEGGAVAFGGGSGQLVAGAFNPDIEQQRLRFSRGGNATFGLPGNFPSRYGGR